MRKPAAKPTLALSFDDGPSLASTALLSPAERHQALLDALARYSATALLFVTVDFGADRPAGLALARHWGRAGHRIGNHTMTHPDLDDSGVSLAQYQREVLACDAVIRRLPGYRKWFRFTYLHAGASRDKREGMRDFLARQGYVDSPVAIDSGDWRLDRQLGQALAGGGAVELAPFRRAYLDQLGRQAVIGWARALASGRAGRPQMVLLHHNLINALWLGDALAMFGAMGWAFGLPDDTFT